MRKFSSLILYDNIFLDFYLSYTRNLKFKLQFSNTFWNILTCIQIHARKFHNLWNIVCLDFYNGGKNSLSRWLRVRTIKNADNFSFAYRKANHKFSIKKYQNIHWNSKFFLPVQNCNSILIRLWIRLYL